LAIHDEEQIGQILRKYLSQKRERAERASCPDEESLAGFLGGNLRGEKKEQLEAHLAGCSLCLDELVAAHKAMGQTETEKIPSQLIEKAMALVPSTQREQGFFEFVVRMTKDSLELVSTSGQSILTPVPLGVRRGSNRAKQSIVQVKKVMGKFKVTAEVERVDPGLCQIVVEVREEGEKPVDGVRVSLVSKGREQASYLTRRGRAVFDRVAKGEYNLPVSSSGGQVGMIRLTVR